MIHQNTVKRNEANCVSDEEIFMTDVYIYVVS